MSARLEPATVRWTYRFLLGRDPESEVVLDAWCASGSLPALMAGIFDGQEIGSLALAGFPERGSWIEGEVTDEALGVALRLRDGAPPVPGAAAELRRQAPGLRALRKILLDSPAIRPRLPRLEGPRQRRLHLPGGEAVLTGDSRDAEFLAAPGLAPRWAAVLRALWPDGGAGRVMLDGGAGIGVTTLGLALGAPAHARLLAHEADLPKAATLAGNIVGNGLARASARAVALADVPAALAREGLDRLDLLRLAEPGAARQAAALAPWLRERGACAIVRFDLAELVADPAGPWAALDACARAFPHLVGFSAAQEPLPLRGDAEVAAALRRTLERPDRQDEFLLCPDLAWLDRYAPG